MRRILAISALALAACAGGGGADDSGTFTVYLTDAPREAASAVRIRVSSVEFISEGAEASDTGATEGEAAGTEETSDAGTTEDEQAGAETVAEHRASLVFDPPREFDLVELRGKKVELGTVTVAGRINQIRLHIDGRAEVEYPDGTTETAKVPSGAETGIKVITRGIEAADIESLTLDFDAEKSIVEAGRKLLLKPTIKAFAGEEEVGESEPVVGTEPAAGSEPEDTEPTATEPTGTEPTGTEPTGTEPTGTEPTGTEPTGTEPTEGSGTEGGEMPPVPPPNP